MKVIMVEKKTDMVKSAPANGMRAIHPGEVLLEEFLRPLQLSPKKLSDFIHLSPPVIWAVVNQKKGITADLAVRLSRALGTSVEFWLNLQSDYDVKIQMEKNKVIYDSIELIVSGS